MVSRMMKFIDFWAPWCGPCKIMNPIVEELEKEFKDVEFEKVNVDEKGDIASKYGVMSIPTFVVEKDGKEIDRKIGAVGKDELVKLLKS